MARFQHVPNVQWEKGSAHIAPIKICAKFNKANKPLETFMHFWTKKSFWATATTAISIIQQKQQNCSSVHCN